MKRSVARIGREPARYGGHSLRSGLATEAARNGVEERVIAKQTRHKSMTVLRGYIQDGRLWEDNAAAATGL